MKELEKISKLVLEVENNLLILNQLTKNEIIKRTKTMGTMNQKIEINNRLEPNKTYEINEIIKIYSEINITKKRLIKLLKQNNIITYNSFLKRVDNKIVRCYKALDK